MRLIKQVGDCHTKRREYDDALEQANRAWTDVLDVPRELVDRMDGPTLAATLREPEKMRFAAQLLAEEAKAYAGKQDPVHAAMCYRRAFELYLEASRAQSGAGRALPDLRDRSDRRRRRRDLRAVAAGAAGRDRSALSRVTAHYFAS